MRVISASIVGLAVLAAVCAPVAGDDGTKKRADGWSTYTFELDPTSAFSVQMPGTPKVQKKLMENIGPAGTDMILHVLDLGAVAYLVTHIDYPPEAVPDAEVALDGARDGCLRNKKKLSEKRVQIAGHAGYDLRAEDANFYSGVRVFLVGLRLYTVVVAIPLAEKEEGEARVARCLESFQLAWKAQPRE